MPHDSAIKYLDAAQFCRQTLGDEIAAKYFNRLHSLAKTNSLDELKAIILGWKVDSTNADALKIGAAFRIPSHIPRQFVEDATQESWVKLFEADGVPDDRAANVAGQTAARDIVRKEEKYVPFPQIETEDGDTVTVELADSDPDEFERVWNRVAGEIRRSKQEELLRTLGADDFWFLIKYMISRRKDRVSRRDRDRASSIRDKLRRHFRRAVGDAWEPA